MAILHPLVTKTKDVLQRCQDTIHSAYYWAAATSDNQTVADNKAVFMRECKELGIEISKVLSEDKG